MPPKINCENPDEIMEAMAKANWTLDDVIRYFEFYLYSDEQITEAWKGFCLTQ